MKFLALTLLLLAAHFSLTPFAPANAGQGKLYWPFAADARSWLPWIGGLPAQSGSVLTPLLAGIAGLGFLAAAAGLLGWVVPAGWFRPLFLAAVGASILLYALYFSPLALLPLALDAALLWSVLSENGAFQALPG